MSEPQTEDEKTFYALGLMLGRNIVSFSYRPDRELALIEAEAFRIKLQKSKAKVDIDKYGPDDRRAQRAASAPRPAPSSRKSKKSAGVIDARFAKEARRRQASVRAWSSRRPVLARGARREPEAADQVKVHYEGKLTDGAATFDSYDQAR